MRWVGHVPRTGEVRNAYRILVGQLEGMEDLDIGEKILLKWVLEK
jgi:hypothetical protein